MPVKWNGKVLKYVLPLLDVFSRTSGLFHWKERKVAQSQRRYQQFTKNTGFLMSFCMTGGENMTVLSVICARSLE